MSGSGSLAGIRPAVPPQSFNRVIGMMEVDANNTGNLGDIVNRSVEALLASANPNAVARLQMECAAGDKRAMLRAAGEIVATLCTGPDSQIAIEWLASTGPNKIDLRLTRK